MIGITTQVIDSSLGKPAKDVAVTLEFHVGHGEWREIGTGLTNARGAVSGLVDKDQPIEAGRYRMTFLTSTYFASQGVRGFYPYISLVFEVADVGEAYHLPLVITPFGYSTGRGAAV